jgi:glycosyltransferase involved in cell wall biosynthesis
MPGRVLMVAYAFPPVAGVGVQRTLKYATYLPRSGWEPVVLTARNPGLSPRDDESERSLPPDLIVERAFSPEPVKLRNAMGHVARTMMRRPGGGAREGNGSAAPAAASHSGGTRAPLGGPLRSMWGQAIRLTFFPDEEVGWVPFAIRRGLEIHRRTPVDAVYSTLAPVSCHLVAGMIAHRTGLPWIADYRDPWMGNMLAAPLPAVHARLQRSIEARFVQLADRSVFATDALMAAYGDRYPQAVGRFRAIPNGYDRSELIGIEPAAPPRPGGFHLLYAGSLYRPNELEAFLLGVELLLDRRPDLRDRLRVDFLGRVNEPNSRLAAQFDTPERLRGVVSYEGFVSHSKALARMAGADALLQLMPDMPGAEVFVGGKLVEYLAFDRPILAVMPRGDGRALVERLPTGIVADVEPGSVAAALERLLDRTPAPAPADPEGRYDRVNLAGQLARLLDEVVSEGQSRRSSAG